jgi:uncharacterized protein with FMN-binding domain
MRRAAAAIGVTVIAMWLTLSFKSSPVARLTAGINATAPGTTVPGSPADTGGQPPAGPPPPGSGATTTTTQAPGSAGRTVNGDVVSTRYGDVQVAIVLNGNHIVDVKALQLPFDRPRSQDISNQAAPLLHDEVLQAQSAQIDTIGGATYTSDAYAQSLQSALDRAHA